MVSYISTEQGKRSNSCIALYYFWKKWWRTIIVLPLVHLYAAIHVLHTTIQVHAIIRGDGSAVAMAMTTKSDQRRSPALIPPPPPASVVYGAMMLMRNAM